MISREPLLDWYTKISPPSAPAAQNPDAPAARQTSILLIRLILFIGSRIPLSLTIAQISGIAEVLRPSVGYARHPAGPSPRRCGMISAFPGINRFMPSFDIVSEVDWHEVDNAVDQANREIGNRYDFKGSDARVERSDGALTVYADNEFQVGQAADILQNKLAKRKVALGALRSAEPETTAGGKARQVITVRSGIEQDLARRMIKSIKASKLKVQASIQGDQVRVSGKKRDDLQAAIAMLKDSEIDLPLQFINFRD